MLTAKTMIGTATVLIYHLSGLPGWAVVVAAPLIMVVMHAAAGVGQGLQEGLRRKVLMWLRSTDAGQRNPLSVRRPLVTADYGKSSDRRWWRAQRLRATYRGARRAKPAGLRSRCPRT